MQSFQTIAVALFCIQQQLLWYKMPTFIYMSKLISYLIYNTILFFRLFLRFSFHIYALSSASGGGAVFMNVTNDNFDSNYKRRSNDMWI